MLSIEREREMVSMHEGCALQFDVPQHANLFFNFCFVLSQVIAKPYTSEKTITVTPEEETSFIM